MARPWAGTSSSSRRRSTTRTTCRTSGTPTPRSRATSSRGTGGCAATTSSILTGTDEHGLKVARAAEENGVTAKAWTDSLEPRWREVWERLDISYDDYIRTTEPRHYASVEKILRAVHDNGRDDIYKGTYEGLYCVSCEAYYVEDDLIEGNCPIHGRPVEQMREENYFFRLSAYADRLLEHYAANPDCDRARAATQRGVEPDPGRPPGLLDQPHDVRLGRAASLGSRARRRTSGSTRSRTTSRRPATRATPSASRACGRPAST